MTRYGVLSDVHGSEAALRAALAFLEHVGVDRVLCAGDLVGYNAGSNECVQAARALGVAAVAGNHDLIALGRMGFERCSDRPAFALRRTRKDLSRATRAALGDLPSLLALEGGGLVVFHGGVRDPGLYMTAARHVEANAALLAASHPAARVCFFGHTHEPRAWAVRGGAAREIHPEGEISLDEPGAVYFVNPGSVDAARRPRPRLAELAVYDAARRTVRFHAVPYDHEGEERRARARGYRMGPLDAWLYRAARTARRGAARAARLIRLAPAGGD